MAGKLKTKSHAVDILFTLALFCVFAASSLLVVLIGAHVYKNTVDSMTSNFDIRTSLSYIQEKMRQNDTSGAAYLDQLGDGTALVLEQNYDGSVYQTWIYTDDGELKELFTHAENEIRPEDGQPIMELPAGSLTMEQLPNGILRLSATGCDGLRTQLLVSPRCG